MSKLVRTILLSAFAILALVAGIVFISNRATTPAYVTVQPGQEAVVLMGEDVVEVLGPGPHRVDMQRNSVVTYQTMFERTYEMPEPLPVAGCPASVAIYYNVGDVVAFHQAGGDADAGAGFGTEVRRLASELTNFSDDPRSEMQVYLRTQLDGTFINGMALTALIVNLEGCEPEGG
ncbi:hypothetical protein A8B78_14200 [Jannaschia sp. EhC01]|nr:hypothetical protein A8B78_14200 [Jannaschia sp. EhC01]